MMITQQTNGLQALQRAVWAFRRLTLFRALLDEPGFREMRAVLEAIASPGTGTNRQAGPDLYHTLFAELSEAARSFESPFHADPWKELVMEAVLFTETLFASTASRGSGAELPGDLVLAAKHDLSLLSDLYRIEPRWLQGAIIQTSPGMPRQPGMLPAWSSLMTPVPDARQDPLGSIRERLAATANWSDAVDELAHWHRTNGAGLPARHAALRWAGSQTGLAPIRRPDSIHLEDMEGYIRQKSIVVENTRRFVQGLPAQNVLLYGERGTGKSSTVKALLWEFQGAGLRMVELNRERLSDIPDVFRCLGARGERFVVFVDDLSFEDSETSYKGLKSSIEGSLEAKPPNVIVYATSNRRHIVREGFNDRDGGPELHGGDGLQEKLSLADRFGISVLYQEPDQEQFSDMVLSLALKRGVHVQEAELRRRALQWAMGGNGLSPRSARQFVDSVVDTWV